MKHPLLPITRALAGLALATAAGLVAAQTAAIPAPSGTPAAMQPATAATPTDKLVSTFSAFAGSEENAASLVNGLRTGVPITLTGGTAVGESITFTSPTKPMGYGNIRIAMSLAEAQLASQGITNPTPTQLQGALMGTTTGIETTTQGILQMRASGMGWGQIANSMGFKLGPVMSGKQTFTEAVAAGSTTTAASTGATETTSAHGRSGVATAGGSSAGKSGVTTAGGSSVGKGAVTTAGGGGGNAYGHGRSSVVTAAGGGGGGALATGLGRGNAGGASAGVVSAAGAAGQGGGQGGGHGRGGGKP